MTETTQMHNTTVENNNTGGVKMEPPVSPSPSEQQYSLKWNDFQQSILSSFRHLRDEEDFVDVTLACDQKSFTAHKVVLSACSPYFRKLLKANPCEHPIVILRDVRAEDVESLLRFMYNGEVHIGHEQLSDFLKTAQLLQVRGLADVTGPTGNNNNSSSNNNNLHGNPMSTSTITPTTISSSSLIPGTHISRTLNSQISASLSTPGVQELKASPTSTSLPWDIPSSDERSNQNTPNPPPQKRVKSAELYRVQHGLSPERLREHLSPLTQHPLHRSRDREMDRDILHRNRDRSRESRDHSLELRESLLGQALEGGPTLIVPSSQSHPDLASIQAQSTGEDSNSSDASDRGDLDDGPMDGMNGSMDHPRTPTFPGAFLGLQGIPGLLPGPSGMHGADNFVSRRSLEMRVRATDPRPCPKCGKIYRSAHTLRTHLEDKHTVCPGYRCVLCGTVAKSRNSLHSHMSRQHRGISTKDLPVLPMPSPFDPDLASRLLAKAGVKISPAELRARASPTSGTRRSDIKLEMRQPGDDDNLDDLEDNDPEDLTMAGGTNNNNNGGGRYHDGLMGLTSPFNHPGTTISRIRPNAMTPKNMEQMNKDSGGSGGATGSAILDTYLQFITENAFNMGMSQEQAAAAMHAAKLAQLGAMGHNIDKLSPGMLPPQFDLSKLDSLQHQHQHDKQNLMSSASVTIEPKPKLNSQQHQQQQQQQQQHHQQQQPDRIDIRRNDSPEPMDLGHESLQSNNNLRDDNKMMMNRTNSGASSNNNNASDTITSSGDEANYSDDDRVGSS